MAKLYEEPIKSVKTEFDQAEVLEIAKKKKLASFEEYDKYVLKNGGWFWTGIWVEIDGKNGKAWHINEPENKKTYTNLPIDDGYCTLDEFGMPKEKCLKSNKDARYFWRLTKYSGLLQRDVVIGGQLVNAVGRPSGRHRVLVEEG
jgi:hypothetical protein